MTQVSAVNWLNSQVGQYRDFDGVYGAQCVDLFDYYYQFLTNRNPLSDGHGVNGAKDLWYQNWADFDKIADSSALVPQPGDVLIYGSSWGGGYGHVEICVSSDANGSTVVGNNLQGNPSLPAQKVYRTWARMGGLLGVLRFRFNGGNAGDSMAATIQSGDVGCVRIITSEVKGWDFNQVHSGAVDAQEMNAWVGQPWTKFINDGWLESEAWRNRRIAALAYYDQKDAHEAQIRDLQTQVNNQQSTITDLTTKLDDKQKDVTKLSDENTALKSQVKDLEAQLAANNCPDVTINFNTIGIVLWSIIKSLGYKKG